MGEKPSFNPFKKYQEKYLVIYRDPDQDRVRDELRTFFGPRAEVYLAAYEKVKAQALERKFILTWNWVVFLTVFPWFFYRRMYGIGALTFLLPIVVGLLFPSVSSGSFVAFAVVAKPIYVQSGIRRIAKANSLGLRGAERNEYLRRAGGVSVVAGVLAGTLFAFLVGFLILLLIVDPTAVR